MSASDGVQELGGMKMYDKDNNKPLILLLMVIGIGFLALGIYAVFLDGQIVALNKEVAVLQEQNLVCVVDSNGIVQYAPDGNKMCDSLRNFATGFYQEHQLALVDHRNAIIDLNRTVAGHEQVLVKIVGDLYQQPEAQEVVQ